MMSCKASILWIVLLLTFSGCVTTPTPKNNVKTDSTLPIVNLTKNGIILDMTSVAFEWESIKDSRVKGIYVYKKSPNIKDDSSELKYLDTINGRFKTHYVDTDIKPDSKYSYSFQTFSEEASSKQSRMINVNSLPVLDSVSWIHSITGMPRTAKIIWRPHSNELVKAYIVERKTLEDEKWVELARVNGRLNAEYIDSELKDNYVYKYRIRVTTYNDIVSTASKIVKVLTKPLPISIKNISATTDLPRRIKLSWDASTQNDFVAYNVYRSEKIDTKYSVIASLENNHYVDVIEEDGKNYFYKVSALDKDGLESDYDKELSHGSTLSKPSSPSITQAKLVGTNIELTWNKTDSRTKNYVIKRTHKKGWFDGKIEYIEGINAQKFIDKNVLAGSTYSYSVFSVDKYSIISEAGIEAKVITPESNIIKNAEVVRPQADQEVENETPLVEIESKVTTKIAPTQDLDLSGL